MRQEMGAPITFAREVQADAAIGHLQGFIDALEALEERETLQKVIFWCVSRLVSAG